MKRTQKYRRDVEILTRMIEDYFRYEHPTSRVASIGNIVTDSSLTAMRAGLVIHDVLKILRERGWQIEYKQLGQYMRVVVTTVPQSTTIHYPPTTVGKRTPRF